MASPDKVKEFPDHGTMLLTQEEFRLRKGKSAKLVIGLPRESNEDEHRVALVPYAVGMLVADGHRVLVENNAGKVSRFSNEMYADAGAEIVYATQEVFQADIIMKIDALSKKEIGMLKGHQVVFSTLNVGNLDEAYIRQLMLKKVTCLAYENLYDRDGNYMVVRSMSEIAGTTSILIAANYLSNTEIGGGVMFGGLSGIPPTEVVILGAGTVGEYAAHAAIGMGALVKVFDNSVDKLQRLQNHVGHRIYTSIIQPRLLEHALVTADVAIGAIHTHSMYSPICVTEAMIMKMKKGSVIIDVSIDQGGCFETSKVTAHQNPVYQMHGVTHYCVPNIPSRVPYTASLALSNLLYPMLKEIGECGGVDAILRTDPGIRNAVYMYHGSLTSAPLSEHFHLPFKDINLLMAAFH